MVKPDSSADASQTDQERQASDPSYRFSVLTGWAVENAERDPTPFHDPEIGPLLVYKLTTGGRPLFLALTDFDPDTEVDDEADDVPLQPPSNVLSRLQTFPLSSLPNPKGADWRIDQLRTGELDEVLFNRGEEYRDPDSKDAIRVAAFEILDGYST